MTVLDDTTPKDKAWKSVVPGFTFTGYVNSSRGRLTFEEVKELYNEVLRREPKEA